MWPFPTKRHLQYPSIEAWLQGEGIKERVFEIADSVERDRRITEYGELRQHLFARHVKTLSPDEQSQLAAGTHPSQSHCFAERAEPYVATLQEHLAQAGFSAKVRLSWNHCDCICLFADLDVDPGERRLELPWLFRGFEVKYNWPHGRK